MYGPLRLELVYTPALYEAEGGSKKAEAVFIFLGEII